MRHLLLAVAIASSGCATSDALRRAALPAAQPVAGTGFEIRHLTLETAKSWTLYEYTVRERVLRPADGELLVVVRYELRDAATGKVDARHAFDSLALEDDRGNRSVSPVRRSNAREAPFIVPAGMEPRALVLDGAAVDVRAAAQVLPTGRFDRIGPRVRINDRVRVTTTEGRVTGDLLAITDDEVHVRHRASRLRFTCAQIRRIETAPDSVSTGATIGAAFGLLPGISMCGARFWCLLGSMSLYGGVGALYDAAIHRPRTLVYVAVPGSCAPQVVR